MRLKTKFRNEVFELGEIVDAEVYHGGSHAIKVTVASHGGMHNFYYDSLKSMQEEWEDAPEEPKDGYIIDPMEEDCVSADDSGYEESDVERAKELGIWFETNGEAQKVAKKLKAFKELRDKGFRFDGWADLQAKMGMDELMLFNRGVIGTDNVIGFRMDDYHDCIKDLNTCFGGEE